MTGILSALIVSVAFTVVLAVTAITEYVTRDRRAVRRAALGEALHGREDGWGIHVAAEDETPEEGEPVQRMLGLMSSGEGYVTYGSTSVHQCCLADRREGRPVCAECAQVMAAQS